MKSLQYNFIFLMEQSNKENLVIKKAISQRVLVAATVVSLLLISGCLYLQLQQKHHLGRINSSNGRRVKSTESVVDATAPTKLQINPTNNNDATFKNFKRNAWNSYDEAYTVDYNHYGGEDYANDATSHINSQEVNRKDPKAIHKSPNTPEIIDNDYGADMEIEYVTPIGENIQLNPKDSLDLNQQCLHCLCTTVNDCKPIKCDHIDPCGIYGISKYYWLDAGSPITSAENDYDYSEENQTHRDYLGCVNNDTCAKETVRNYMKRYQRDCNNDGVIDCQDYIALHMLGPSGCTHKELSPIHTFRTKSCLK